MSTISTCSISPPERLGMSMVSITRDEFLQDRQGRTYADLLNGSPQALDDAIAFFNDADRQRRMQESEIHHDRAALAGVVRELECQPSIEQVLASRDARRSQRLRQAVGVVVRMVMEKLGWKKTGKKGSLGVRSEVPQRPPFHNTGGLALWFLRAERYSPPANLPFASVKTRCKNLPAPRRPGANALPRRKTVNGSPTSPRRRGTR